MALSLFPLPATALAAALSFFCSLFLSPSVGSGFASHLRSDAVPPGSAAASLSFSSAVFSSAVHGSWPFFLFLRGLFSWREAVALPPGALPWFTECGLSSDRFGLGRGPPLCLRRQYGVILLRRGSQSRWSGCSPTPPIALALFHSLSSLLSVRLGSLVLPSWAVPWGHAAPADLLGFGRLGIRTGLGLAGWGGSFTPPRALAFFHSLPSLHEMVAGPSARASPPLRRRGSGPWLLLCSLGSRVSHGPPWMFGPLGMSVRV